MYTLHGRHMCTVCYIFSTLMCTLHGRYMCTVSYIFSTLMYTLHGRHTCTVNYIFSTVMYTLHGRHMCTGLRYSLWICKIIKRLLDCCWFCKIWSEFTDRQTAYSPWISLIFHVQDIKCWKFFQPQRTLFRPSPFINFRKFQFQHL